jgi:tetratricopeptide (TPR) repeat protein
MRWRRFLSVLPVVGLLVAVAGGGDLDRAAEGNWTGQRVLATKPADQIAFAEKIADKRPALPFRAVYPVPVREDRDGRVRLFDGYREGWANKADFVLGRDAPIYFTDRIRANPTDAWAWVQRGLGWDERDEYDNAIKDFTEAIRLEPKSVRAFDGRGVARSEKGEHDAAVRDFTEAIWLDPRDARAFRHRGDARWASGDQDGALNDYGEAVRVDPGYAGAFYSRGVAWLEKGDYNRAISDFDRALRIDPQDVQTLAKRARVRAEKREFDKAIQDYTEAIQLKPSPTAFKGRGAAYTSKGAHDRAVRDFEEALRLDPKDRDALLSRGFSRGYRGDLDGAIQDFDYALRQDARDEIALTGRATAWLHKGERERAFQDLNEAVLLGLPSGWPQFHLAVAELVVGHSDQAAEEFRSALRRQGWRGELPQYCVILGHLAARRAGNEAEAKRFLDASAGRLDLDIWPFAAIRLLKGEIDEARLLELAVDNDRRTEARCFLALDQALKGNKEAALTHLRWVKEHGNRAVTEYDIAAAELDRLERESAASKP